VAAFEREFSEWTGAPFACAVSSGTAALHLALLAAGVAPGDDVLTVSHSYVATANSVRHCGAQPVFIDIDPATFNMDPRLLEGALTSRTRAILCVHQLGMPCDLPAIARFARERGLPLVEDAACAIGSRIAWNGAWEPIGRPHGDAACFSFHPRKIVTTGDGGMITTAHPDWDARARRLRQHGAAGGAAESFAEVGFNYRMTDIQAAVGRAQLRRLAPMIERRRQVAVAYREALAYVPGLQLPPEPEWARSNWQSFCVRLPGTVSAAAVATSLAAIGIATRPGVMNAHEQLAYRDHRSARLPESERARRECLMLPFAHDLSPAEIERVARALEQACRAPATTASPAFGAR
jgi:dTDP-4-amino-4,6-dideoxygalactose transaminase